MVSRSTLRHTSAHTYKLVISAASIATTLAGWALLAIQPAVESQQFEPLPDVSGTPAVVTAPPPAWLSEPPAIPALPPLVEPVHITAEVVQPTQPDQAQIASPVTAPAVSSNPPAPPALREVSAPVIVNPPVQAQRPAPVVVTRSSR
ncbi:hypothetical protein [Roseiflexus sp.]|uniref:hypothetical protein n=1 Tax=Roseiflexus sp. TaxID=2562120 RepID=UPI00398A9C6E